ncbi:MAG: hypothetical protein AVO34_12215 [Firmicutes bacterium ML8_F2]|jgi:uridine kinase|nr:MAG: hypothetical protein AVO34_12215 [Firmicutes bacterium ML8_F2]
MIGDKLIVTDYHRQAAALIYKQIYQVLEKCEKPFAITIAGESGSGKSETAVALADLINQAGLNVIILQQDDYFIYPPQTNHEKRIDDISWVGMQEVKLDLIDQHLEQVKSGSLKTLVKPLVHYEKDEIIQEELTTDGVKVVIAEGTYTTALKNADFKAFIDRTYLQTKKARQVRSREKYSPFIERVLDIEHEIISSHKKIADLIIPAPEEESVN